MYRHVYGERSSFQKKLKIVWDKAADIGFDNDVVVFPTVIPAQEYDEYKSRLPYYRNIAMEGGRLDDLVIYRLGMAEERLNSSRILLDAGQYKDSIGANYNFVNRKMKKI